MIWPYLLVFEFPQMIVGFVGFVVFFCFVLIEFQLTIFQLETANYQIISN